MCYLCDNPSISDMESLTIHGCGRIININMSMMPNIRLLYAGNCPNLAYIPNLSNLLELDLYECNAITEIPNIESLKSLKLTDCLNITVLPVFSGLKNLYLRNSKVSTIPYIEGLDELILEECSNIRDLPVIDGLEIVYIDQCHNITEFPYIVTLNEITIDDCRGLKAIFKRELVYLTLIDCPMLTYVQNMDNDLIMECKNCPWVNIDNTEYTENIRKLGVLQRWFKGNYLSKKLSEYMGDIINIYYKPEMKGYYLAHKNYINTYLKINGVIEMSESKEESKEESKNIKCSSCGDDVKPEDYQELHCTDTETHGICPKCCESIMYLNDRCDTNIFTCPEKGCVKYVFGPT